MSGKLWGRALALIVTLAGLWAAPSVAGAAEWDFGDRLPMSGPSVVLDPTTHTFYFTRYACSPRGGCISSRWILRDGVATPTDEELPTAFDPTDGTRWTFSGTGFELARAGAALPRLELGATPGFPVFDATDGSAYVVIGRAGAQSELVTIRDGAVRARLALPFAPVTGPVVDEGTHSVLLGDGAGKLYRVSGGALGEPQAVPDGGLRLAVDPRTHTVYATNRDRPELLVIAADGTVDRLPLAGFPGAPAVEPRSGDAFVSTMPSGGSGTPATLHVVRDGRIVDTRDDGPAGGTELLVDPVRHSLVAIGDWGGARELVLTDRPSVRWRAPRPDAEPAAPAAPLIVAVFTKAMDRASVEGAFTVRVRDGAPVAGHVVWFGEQAAIFVPDAPLPAGLTFTATVSGDARSAAGDALLLPASWELRTRPVVRVAGGIAGAPDVYAVPRGSVFYAVYDGAVEHAGVEEHTTLVRTSDDSVVPGRFGWFGPSTVVFVPDEPLAANTSYVFSPADGYPVRSVGGGFLEASKLGAVSFITGS